MILFVTVGTTEFNQLVSLISSEGLHILKSHGFNKVVIQVGKGDPPNESCVPGIEVEHYTFKPSTYDDIKAASLVISHAGAGTVLDVMDQHKPFIAVVNPELMGNHQTELALHLHRLGHLEYCTPDTLLETLENLDLASFTPLPPGDPHKLGQYLDNVMGFT